MDTSAQEPNAESYEVAVIGMAGRFPGSPDLDAYWRTLCEGVERITFFSDDELEMDGLTAEQLQHPQLVKARAILDDIDLFDADFFNISARTAEWMDPQQRLFLECAWQALEDAGYDASTYAGAVAVYAGSSLNSYILSRLPYLAAIEGAPDVFQLAIANDKDHLATRVSYKLNLRGEGVTIQTACSTSLVAVHFACQSLLSGQCDMALAGGVSIQVPQKTGYLYQEGMISSPDGHCRAFDERAQGTVSGNGLGVVVLKLLSEAVKDGDHIYAVIKGSAINNDGHLKMGYTAPSIQGQAEVIARALAMACVEPDTVSYVEAHGTGTPVGDPIEVEALTQVYRRSTQRKQFCALGAVKTNIGHLDAAAGVAGLIKACLSLKHGALAPTLHFTRPNPTIDFANSPFYVNDRLRDWPRGTTPRRAAVSSFGIGGTNAHVVLEEAPAPDASGESRPCQVLTLSAKSPRALRQRAEALARRLEEDATLDLADVAYTCNVGRQAHAFRQFAIAEDRASALRALRALAERTVAAPVSGRERRVAFLFPGQGAQTVGMARALYACEPEFRQRLEECAALLKRRAGLDLLALLYPAGGETREAAHELAQPARTLPALFAVEYALARLWMNWGVKPHALAGHSFGEYVAACLAGVFTLEEALLLAVERGRLMQRLEPGAMLGVRLAEAEAREFATGGLSVAAVNSRHSCVLAGPVEEVERLEARLAERQVGCRRLDVPFAYHSSMIDAILPEFTALIGRVRLKAPTVPYISCLTGRWVRAEEATDPLYWARQMRQGVRFAAGLDTLVEGKCDVLLEVGPGQTLTTLARQHFGKQAGLVVQPSLGRAAAASLAESGTPEALGQLWTEGCRIDWQAYYRAERRRRLSLPTYPFERQRYWVETRGRRLVLEGAETTAGTPEASRVEASAEAHEAPRPETPARHEVERSRLSSEFVAPRDEVEATLARIWSDVLGVEGIGVRDDFYELGGDSLLATQVFARVAQSFGDTVTLRDVLSHQTIEEFAARVGQSAPVAAAAGPRDAALTIPRVARDAELPLSFAQQRLWFIHQLAPDSSVYNLGNAIRMEGRLDAPALERSLNEIVRRHETLRTRFVEHDGRPVQQIDAEMRLPLPVTDLSHLPADEREEQVARLAAEEARQPFDLAGGPLLRARLVRLAEDEHVALFCMHHIISDGWSFGLLAREVSVLYEAFAAGRPSPLRELPVQYADFAAWQRARLQGEPLREALNYWRRQLDGAPPVLALPTDRPRPAVQTFRGASLPFNISAELTAGLKALARVEGATLYTLLLAAFTTLLHRTAQQDEIVVGSPVAGRSLFETEELIGLFLNTVALRSDCSGNPPFREFLRGVRETTLGAFANQDVPFELLVDALLPERSLSHNPVFQVFFNFQNTPAQPLDIDGLRLTRLEFDNRAVALDLILNMVESGEQLNGVVQYNTDLFDAATITRLVGRFERLLGSIVARPDAGLKALELLTAEEQQREAAAERARAEALRGSLRSARRRSIELASEPAALAHDPVESSRDDAATTRVG